MSRSRFAVVAVGCLALVSASVRVAAQSSDNNDRLKEALKTYPDADADGDGVLTASEARQYLRKNAGKIELPEARRPAGPEPTLENVKYGPHERNVLDFWKAKSDAPTPVIVFIHGGGFRNGDKGGIRSDGIIQQSLDGGVSFASINYRFRPEAPIQDILRDCARAIQFVRFKADDWNVDKTRVAAYGGSAGAGTSLWLAFHDDLADPKSADPVLRESSRLACAGANSAQATYDLMGWRSLFGDAVDRFETPDEWYTFYGLESAEDAESANGKACRADCDMLSLISKDDPPVFLSSTQPGGEVSNRGHLLHHPKHAEAVLNRCREVGVEGSASLPGLGIKPLADQPQDVKAFLFAQLLER